MKMPACTKKNGICFAMPDVCLTPAPPAPPVPVPYPNQAMLAQADRAVDKVLIEKKEVIVEDSKVPQTMGDEAGTNGGVASGTNRGEATFRVFSSKVLAKGKKIVFLGAQTAHNGSSANAPLGSIVAPSQNKVFVAP
jgi:hypothetical protein